MSFHVDIMVYKVRQAQMKEQIYFTTIYIYRCDYSTADIAVIADVVLGQFRMDVPGVIHKFRLLSGEPLS